MYDYAFGAGIAGIWISLSEFLDHFEKREIPRFAWTNGGFYGQHSFWTAPFNLIRVQFGISQASDILLVGVLSFIRREEKEKGFNLYAETWQQLCSLSFLSLFIFSQDSQNQDGCVYITLILLTELN